MSAISVERLAELGRDRFISPLFEQAWLHEERTANPVTTAIRIVDNGRRKWNRACLKSVMVMLVFVFLGVVGEFLYFVSNKGNSVGFALVCLVPAILLIVAMITTSLAIEGKSEWEVSEESKVSLAYFCDTLALVADWVGSGTFYQHIVDQENIKKIGTQILAAAACFVLEKQNKEKEAQTLEMKARLQEAAGNEMIEFTRRYNTLKKLGMASGGYDKYFDAGRQMLTNNRE